MLDILSLDGLTPEQLRKTAALLESAPKQSAALNDLIKAVEHSTNVLNNAWADHQALMAELQAEAEALSVVSEQQTYSNDIVIDNVIVNVEIQFEINTRLKTHGRVISGVRIKRKGKTLDIIPRNSDTIIVCEGHELVMGISLRSLVGNSTEETLHLILSAVKQWALARRHDNHYDLIIKLLLKCKVIVELPDSNQSPTPYTHGTRFWREGHFRWRNGVPHWVAGHFVTR